MYIHIVLYSVRTCCHSPVRIPYDWALRTEMTCPGTLQSTRTQGGRQRGCAGVGVLGGGIWASLRGEEWGGTVWKERRGVMNRVGTQWRGKREDENT
jgi:hypothetical protein